MVICQTYVKLLKLLSFISSKSNTILFKNLSSRMNFQFKKDSIMKKLLIVLFLFVSTVTTAIKAEQVESFQYMGDNLLLPIPDGFCNATEELSGIFIMDYMNSQISNGMDVPPAVIAFTRCGFENDLAELYPFGYITLIENSKPVSTQKSFNKMLGKLLDSSKMMQKIQETADDATQKTGSEYGIEIDGFGVDKSTLTWIDENVAIVTTRMEYAIDGETYNEYSVQGSTALNKSIVNYYIWDEAPGLTTPKENALTLINNSKLLVRMNK